MREYSHSFPTASEWNVRFKVYQQSHFSKLEYTNSKTINRTSLSHGFEVLELKGRKRSIKFMFSVQILSFSGASDRPLKKIGELSF